MNTYSRQALYIFCCHTIACLIFSTLWLQKCHAHLHSNSVTLLLSLSLYVFIEAIHDDNLIVLCSECDVIVFYLSPSPSLPLSLSLSLSLSLLLSITPFLPLHVRLSPSKQFCYYSRVPMHYMPKLIHIHGGLPTLFIVPTPNKHVKCPCESSLFCLCLFCSEYRQCSS